MKKKNAPQNNWENLTEHQSQLLEIIRTACKKIAPLWSLDSFVAVNPYLGFTAKKFEHVAQELSIAGDIEMTLPASFYLKKIKEGDISLDDIGKVLNKKNITISPSDFIKTIKPKQPILPKAPTISRFTTEITSKDWNRFFISRITTWAASYFDNGQAIWSASYTELSPFLAWKQEAEVDRTPELIGLKNYRNSVKNIPDQPLQAIKVALNRLNIPTEGIPLYLHSLLLSVGGWSAYAARLDWENELYGGTDGILIELLAILTSSELCLMDSIVSDHKTKKWETACEFYKTTQSNGLINEALNQKLILQEAFDLAAQKNIINKFKGHVTEKKELQRPKAQAVFCIDVRSEVYRRNLESVNPDIETLGFAGFFAFPIKYKPFGHESGEAQCPVLLKTGPTIMEEMPGENKRNQVVKQRIQNRQLKQMWKSFKSGAITCFSFVSPMGLSYLPKLYTDSFGLSRPVPHPDKIGLSQEAQKKKTISLLAKTEQGEFVGIPLEQQIEMAKNALTAMSLKENFAPFVLITGHGSTMVNNPHATGYDCGACGGHSGEANAKVAAAVLNNKEVRLALAKESIFIPDDTTFLACLHDTTTDQVSIYNEHDVPTQQDSAYKDLLASLAQAGKTTRMERSLRLFSDKQKNTDRAIAVRSKDWSQVRPEWGLAGCSAFVVAPRERTQGLDFEGKSFLHSYDWKKDKNFSVLELIMTAPMVVTSWINLQYYGSTVDNFHFGAGNKTLHNVTGGIGVLEGYSGDLRVGLPIQAVHDGVNYQHEPLKLSVIIEAPLEAINSILEKHKAVRDLCDNGWIQLMAMDDDGVVSHAYKENLNWNPVKEIAA